MLHVRTCKGCGAPFTPVNSLYESHCQKCQNRPVEDFLIDPFKDTPLSVMSNPEKNNWMKERFREFQEGNPGLSVYVLTDNGKIGPFSPGAFGYPHMTPTAWELLNDREFWKKRIEQQTEYIARLNRPDRTDIFDTALFILQECQRKYLSLAEPTHRQPHGSKGKEVAT